MLLQDDQRLVRGGGLVDFPGPLGQVVKQLADHFQERHAVVHHQHLEFLGRLFLRLARRFRRRRQFDFGRRGHGRGHFQAQLNVAQAQRFTGLEHAFGNHHALDERPVGRAQVAHVEFLAAQPDLAMLAGDGRVEDLKRVSVRASNRDPVRPQLMRQAGRRLRNDNKFGHVTNLTLTEWNFKSSTVK